MRTSHRLQALLLIASFLVISTLHGAVIRVDSTADDGASSLRQAIRNAADGDEVVIRVEEPIKLTTGRILIEESIRIEGENGPSLHSISGEGFSSIFEIAQSATVTLARLTLANGSTSQDGGAILNKGNLTLDAVVIRDSYADRSGGAVFQTDGSLVVHRSHLVSNSSGTSGGAISISSGSLSISSTGFGGDEQSGNIATGLGGALFLNTSSGPASISSSTFSNNASEGGGAIAIMASHADAANLTLISNYSDQAGTAHIAIGNTATFNLANSLVQTSDLSSDGLGGANLIGLNLTGSLEELGLGELDDFGGVSPTYPILPGSPAIDSGDDGLLLAMNPQARDQRGLTRFSDGNGDGVDASVDLGAFEIQNYHVTATQIRGSATGGVDDEGFGNSIDPSDDAASIASADVFSILSDAGKADIGDAVGANNAAGGGSISFAPSLDGKTLSLKGTELKVRRNAAIYGLGADRLAISGNNRSPVIRVSDHAMLHVQDISLVNGRSADGGGIVIESDSRVEMESVSLNNNSATTSGGALAVLSGDAVIYRSALLNNSAGASGGAVFGGTNSFIHINNSTLSGNTAGGGAHAVSSTGFLEIDSSTLVGDTPPAIQLGKGEDGYIWNSILLSGGPSVSLADSTNLLNVQYNDSGDISGNFNGFNLSDSSEPNFAAATYIVADSEIPVIERTLAYNGGTTLTHALIPYSEAINAGLDTGMSDVDQRGAQRPRGGQNDIGSFELQNDAPKIIKTNNPVVIECGTTGSNSAPVTLEVFDFDGDPLTVEWKFGDQTFTDPVPATNIVSRTFDVPFGISTVTAFVSDPYSSSAERAITISVVDNIKPELTVSRSEIQVTADPLSCDQTVSVNFTATDSCTGVARIDYTINGGTPVSVSPVSPIQLQLGVGTYSLEVTAVDGSNNASDPAYVMVNVQDKTAPSLTVPADIAVDADSGSCFATVSLASTASDTCPGNVIVTYTVNGEGLDPANPGNKTISTGDFEVGTHQVVVTATDTAGNFTSKTVLVTVADATDPVFDTGTIPIDPILLQTDPGFCSAQYPFNVTATDACSGIESIGYKIINEAGTSTTVTQMPFRFERGVNTVVAIATDNAGNFTASDPWMVEVQDEDNNCVYNLAWPLAYELDLQGNTQAADSTTTGTESPKLFKGSFQQYLAFNDQARWFKFFVKPGSKVSVLLTGDPEEGLPLPGNYDIVVYRDIQEEYDRLYNLFTSGDPEDQKLALLGVEFAPESWSPESWSPESWSPESWSPESYSPIAFSPLAFSPESWSPESWSPESWSPESWSPESWSPESYSPESWSADVFAPESWSPESWSPESWSPESWSEESWSPESWSPESWSQESFSSAQVSSIVAFSAFPGVANEGVRLNTYTESGYYYVRVRGSNGSFSTDAPFHLNVLVQEDLCSEIKTEDQLAESTYEISQEHLISSYKTLIVWDSMMMPDPDGSVFNKLQELAAQTDVQGVVIDVSDANRVEEANLQAIDYPECIYAKNLVATEIKKVIDLWWAENKDSLEYIVLVGNDDVIPFFRTTDEAFLANEANYIPPVRDGTHSQSALRYGQVLTQDPYGAECDLSLRTGPFPFPKLAVGRLVESPTDILSQIDNYLSSFLPDAQIPGFANGTMLPSNALVTGYDFLDDAAFEVFDEFDKALNLNEGDTNVDALISLSTAAPADSWTADDLASIFLGKRHDMVFLAGHFSTGSSLAADYVTRLTAAQVLNSGANLLNSLIFSIGCHSGYNTVDAHAITGVTKQPDWAQVFGRMGATYIAGTGYQYGDTEYVEYGERLYAEFTRELRTGPDAVPVGKALVNAKQRYLAETPLMRGIHEKTLLQTTLFGLPMMQIDVPGTRIEPMASESVILNDSENTSAAEIQVPATGPGVFLGLKTYELTIDTSLTETSMPLDVENTSGEEKDTVIATWFTGKNGIVTNPVEPTRPLEVYDVTVPNTWLRGVGFLGGSYDEIQGILPLTGAPATEIRGAYGNFFSETFFPTQPYNTNYIGAICGGTEGERLNIYPAQFISRFGFPDDPDIGGTYRAYEQMTFKLFYSDDTRVFPSEYGEIIPALAPPPSIARVSSTIVGDTVEFSVNVVGSPAAGIQEVWITQTRDVGISSSGMWESIFLVQDSEDSTLWRGTMPLTDGDTGAAIDPETVRFIVQAASGTGMVALNSNFGQYYIPGRDSSTLRTRTQISGLTGETSVKYGDVITVSATLTDRETGNPLVDDDGLEIGEIEFRVGTSRKRVATTGGVASTSFKVTTLPDTNLRLQANFAGNADYAASSTEKAIDVLKQHTFLAPVAQPAPTDAVNGSDIVFALTAGENIAPNESTPLKERTVFFLVEYYNADDQQDTPTGLKIGNPVITDFAGRADLAEVSLPAGTARVTAYFNRIKLPDTDGTIVTISDELYEPADPVSIIVTLRQPFTEDSLGFTPSQVDVYYKASGKGRKAGPPEYTNASLTGEVVFNVPLQPQDLLDGLTTYPYITARVEARLSGITIADEAEILLDTRGNNGNHWTTTSRPGFNVSYVGIHWSDAPRFDSALSNSPGPRIYTAFIGNNFTEYHVIPEPGRSFETQFPDGGPTVAFSNGVFAENQSSGLVDGEYTWDGQELTFTVKSGLQPGDSFLTSYDPKDGGATLPPVTVVNEVNYLEEGGRMIVRLDNIDLQQVPTSDDPNNYLECRIILGPEDGVHVRSIARVGEGLFAVPWSSEDPGHKQYRP